MDKARYLLLENGAVFKGKAFGAEGDVTGEVVFTTGMTGYLETLTDPGYYGQIIIQTFPLIGNYGVIPQDFESRKSFVKGYIVRDWCQEPSNFRNQGDLDTFLREQNIPGIYGIDTRALTRMVRENGVMNAVILSELPEDNSAVAWEMKNYRITEAVASTSCTEREECPRTEETAAPKKVAILDLGMRRNSCRELQKRGCDVVILPYNTTAEEILALNPDGIMISDGPGDPAENVEVIREIKKLMNAGVPVFGACLGHQLIALAAGARTVKMKHGHRGASQPARRIADGKVYITSQNHGYEVVTESLPANAEVSFVNVNDNTCEGITYKDIPVFSVQFTPESCCGPLNTLSLFDEFVKLMEEVK